MLIVVRRVKQASVVVDNETVGAIENGLLLYVGLEKTDTQKECQELAAKIAKLRLFDGTDSEINVVESGGRILSVSQFTLAADTKKGNRPSFTQAMPSGEASPLFDYFNQVLAKEVGFAIETGRFGAYMLISAIDDGPYTILLKSQT